MSRFGEPWERENSRPHLSHSRDFIYRADSTRVCDTRNDTETADRIVACVNALAGLNPERLRALLDAIGLAKGFSFDENDNAILIRNDWIRILDAYRALRDEETTK